MSTPKTRPKPRRSPRTSLDDALDAYLLQLEADGRSPHTIGQARRHVRLFASWAASVGLSRDVRAIGHRDVAGFLTAPQARTRPDGQPKKASSVNALRSSLRAFWRYAVVAGYVDVDPTRLVRRARTGPRVPRGAAREDLDRVLHNLSTSDSTTATRDRLMFLVLRRTGIRVGALVGLGVEDVDVAGETLRIRTKGDAEQRVPVGGELLDALCSWIGDRSEGPLFPSNRGERMTTRHVARRLAAWCERAGIERISPHQLRHAFATELYQRTGDLRLVQAALGHASIASTMVYARVDDSTIREAVRSLSS